MNTKLVLTRIIIAKKGHILDTTDEDQLHQDIADGLLFFYDVWMKEDLNDTPDFIDINNTQQAVGRDKEKRLKITVKGFLSDLQNMGSLNDGEWSLYEVYEDESVGGHSYSEPNLYPFDLSLIFADQIIGENEELPTRRDLYLNYKYPSQISDNRAKVYTELSISDVNNTIYVSLDGKQNGEVYASVITGEYGNDDFCMISGLEDYFKYGDGTLATGISEIYAGRYIGFDEDKGSITLINVSDQLGNPRYSTDDSLTVVTVWGYNDEVLTDNTNVTLIEEYS